MSMQHKEIRSKVRQYPYPAKVADALGVHHSTVYRACEGMDIALIRDAYEADIPLREIVETLAYLPVTVVATKLGISKQYVYEIISDGEAVYA